MLVEVGSPLAVIPEPEGYRLPALALDPHVEPIEPQQRHRQSPSWRREGDVKAMKFQFFRRVTAFCSSAVIVLALLIAGFAPTPAVGQTSVFVPGAAGGCFWGGRGGGGADP